jgi:hypothetical protein
MKPKPLILTFSGRINDREAVDLATVAVPHNGTEIDRDELRRRLHAVFGKIAAELGKDLLK